MALSAAERQRRRYARNPEHVRALANAWYWAHWEECAARRRTEEIRARRREYMRRRRQEEAGL
jgi:hypothetical protein